MTSWVSWMLSTIIRLPIKELNIKDLAKRTAGDALAMIEEGPSEIDPKSKRKNV